MDMLLIIHNVQQDIRIAVGFQESRSTQLKIYYRSINY